MFLTRIKLIFQLKKGINFFFIIFSTYISVHNPVEYSNLSSKKTMVSSKQAQRCCEKDVKEIASLSERKSHKKCSSTHQNKPTHVSGSHLQRYFGVRSVLERHKFYCICRNLERSLIKAKIIEGKRQVLKTPTSPTTNNPRCPPSPIRRSPRISNHYQSKRSNLQEVVKKLKFVEVKFQDRHTIEINSESEYEESVSSVNELYESSIDGDDNAFEASIQRSRRSKNEIFLEKLNDELKHGNQKCYTHLSKRYKRTQITDLSLMVIANCIENRKEFEKKGMEYIIKNEVLAMNCLTLLDDIKFEVQMITKLKEMNLSHEDEVIMNRKGDEINDKKK